MLATPQANMTYDARTNITIRTAVTILVHIRQFDGPVPRSFI
jgi:hypothetical protein